MKVNIENIMSEKLETIIFAFFCGVFIGLLLGITIKYPAKIENIEKYQSLCGATEHITQAKIGIMGDIYSIECSNGIEVQVRH
jgi:hypothetical protein